jgi:putative DNA primase/helicase
MTGPFITHARQLIENGYSPVPLVPGAKRPIHDKWEALREATITEKLLQETVSKHPKAGVGVAGGYNGLVPIDVDTDDPAIKAAVFKVLPKTPVAKKGSKGGTLFYRSRAPIPGRKFIGLNSKPIVEVLTSGQTVIPPTRHPDTREPYRWTTGATLLDTCVDDLSEITLEHIFALQEALRPWLRPQKTHKPYSNGNGANGAHKASGTRIRAYAAAALDGEAKQLAMIGEGGRNYGLFAAVCKLGNYVHHGVLSQSETHTALLDACTANGYIKGHGSAAFEKTFRSGLEWSADDELREPPPGKEQPRGNADPETTATTPELPLSSDEALALKFADQHGGEYRYTHKWAQWHHYAGQCWREDVTLSYYDRARRLCRELAAGIEKPGEARDTASAKKRAAVISLAREDRRIAATVEQWDRDPWLLSTPEGTIDLRTGETRAHSAADYITKITAVAPGGECPRWRLFLKEITGGDVELAAYLQRVVGYSLTGDTREHALFFLYGTGGNGKGVLLSTLAGILACYHRAAPIEAFTASLGDRHPSEIAMLRGARLVTAVETEEGRYWAESRIKQLTGGDRVAARFMKQDWFEYTPEFKLLIAGNHKPALRSVDESIRRRFHLVPFNVTIDASQRDLELSQKLKAEWPGILQWAIDGCAMWQQQGLAPPRAVTDATAAYLEAEDRVRTWIDERCERVPPTIEKPLKELYGWWRSYCEASGDDPRTDRWLRDRLEVLGFTTRKSQKGRQICGLQPARDR